MKKKTAKIMSLLLCASIILGSISGVVGAANTKSAVKETSPAVTETKTAPSSPEDTKKDETVYVITSADGSVEKIIVSDWIKNRLEGGLSDRSELSDIENTKGDESYTMNGDSSLVWDAEGNDIYYQGSIDKELPVGITVSYWLDGKRVSADDLAGKSGRVTIRFDYDNRQYEQVNIDGKQEKIYVPFVMLTGMLLDDEAFTNVEVTNGKLINEGDRTAVIGIALPGLQEDLNLDKSKLDIPEHVEITADVTDFELGMTVTVAVNDIFSSLDTDKLDSIDDLTGSLDELNDAMNQLIDGSSELYGGLNTLLDKSGELVNGISQLADGAKELRDGTAVVDDGTGALKNGISTLYSGLSTLDESGDTLVAAAKQIFDALLDNANVQIGETELKIPELTTGNYSDTLSGVIESLDETTVYEQALSTVTEAVEANRPQIEAAVTEAIHAQVAEQVKSGVEAQITETVRAAVNEEVTAQVISSATGGMTKAEYEAAVSSGAIDEETHAAIENAISSALSSKSTEDIIAGKVEEQMADDDVTAAVNAEIAEQNESQAVKDKIAENIEIQVEKAISESMASDEVQSRLNAASAGSQTLITLKTSLDSYNSFYLGLVAYTNGVTSLKEGAGQLYSGAAQLKDGTSALRTGADSLYNGILQLKNGAPALVDGITKLRDGSMQLSDGLKEFDEKGIKKLTEAVNGDLEGLIQRLNATIEVSKNYRNFSGISDDMEGEVKFVYRSDSIER
jgi:putative membrane protein